MRRPRGPGGRFLTAEEIAAQKAQQEVEAGPSGSASVDGEGEDDDDAMGEPSKDNEMSIDGPLEVPMPAPAPAPAPPQPQPQQADKQRETGPPASAPTQPLLQPRPEPASAVQPQIQAQAQQHQTPMVTQQTTPAPKPNPSPLPPAPIQSPPQPAQSPFNPQLGHSAASVNLLNLGFPTSMSHPTTPTPLSPQSDAMNPFEHVQTPDPFQRSQTLHDHSRTMTTAAGTSRPIGAHAHSHAGQPGQAVHMRAPLPPAPAVPPPQNPAAASSIPLRPPYHAAMQMHHVPHPHAHRRHHASFINRTERLYGAPGDHHVMNISAEGIKGDLQRRGSDLMRGFGNASNSK